MINDVVQAIAIALHKEFGDAYQIYADDIAQGLTGPCFFIAQLSVTLVPYIGKRRNNACLFDIHYFSKTRTNSELNAVAVRLFDCLRLIASPQSHQYLGSDIHTEKEDGVLHCFVTYHFTTRDEIVKDNTMTDMDITSELEGMNDEKENRTERNYR